MKRVDIVFAERAAFVAGYTLAETSTTQLSAEELAERRYPIPTVTRPRVADDPEKTGQWCVMDGALRWRDAPHSVWLKWMDFQRASPSPTPPIPARVLVWADLLNNPTETVPDDA